MVAAASAYAETLCEAEHEGVGLGAQGEAGAAAFGEARGRIRTDPSMENKNPAVSGGCRGVASKLAPTRGGLISWRRRRRLARRRVVQARAKQQEQHEQALGGKLPEMLCFRYTPGKLKEGNAIIGKPEDAKYGFTREQLFEGYRLLANKGVKRFGLHTMVALNELNADYFVETTQMLFDLVVELHRELGIKFEFLNLGGGIGIPYKPEQTAVDLALVGRKLGEAYRRPSWRINWARSASPWNAAG